VATGELQQTLKGELQGDLQQTLEGYLGWVKSVAFSLYSISSNWISDRTVREMRNILWLPPAYRFSSVSIYKDIIALGLFSGSVFFLRLEHGSHIL
jgi:hypothetical protein